MLFVIMPKNGGTLTLNVVLELTPLEVAVTVVVPVFSPVARPAELTDATSDGADDHTTLELMSFELPSLNVPIALNWAVPCTTRLGDAGVTEIEDSCEPLPPVPLLLLPPPHPVKRPEISKRTNAVLRTLGASLLLRTSQQIRWAEPVNCSQKING
jgi:hypothetical protein